MSGAKIHGSALSSAPVIPTAPNGRVADNAAEVGHLHEVRRPDSTRASSAESLMTSSSLSCSKVTVAPWTRRCGLRRRICPQGGCRPPGSADAGASNGVSDTYGLRTGRGPKRVMGGVLRSPEGGVRCRLETEKVPALGRGGRTVVGGIDKGKGVVGAERVDSGGTWGCGSP